MIKFRRQQISEIFRVPPPSFDAIRCNWIQRIHTISRFACLLFTCVALSVIEDCAFNPLCQQLPAPHRYLHSHSAMLSPAGNLANSVNFSWIVHSMNLIQPYTAALQHTAHLITCKWRFKKCLLTCLDLQTFHWIFTEFCGIQGQGELLGKSIHSKKFSFILRCSRLFNWICGARSQCLSFDCLGFQGHLPSKFSVKKFFVCLACFTKLFQRVSLPKRVFGQSFPYEVHMIICSWIHEQFYSIYQI